MGNRVVWPNFEVFEVLPKYVEFCDVLSPCFFYFFILQVDFELLLLNQGFDSIKLGRFLNNLVLFFSVDMSLCVEVALVLSVQATKHLLDVACISQLFRFHVVPLSWVHTNEPCVFFVTKRGKVDGHLR